MESIAQLLALDDDSLLERLGHELTIGRLGATNSRPKLIQIARNWFILNQQHVSHTLCGSTQLRQLCQSETVSTTIDIAGLVLVLLETIEKSGAAILIACLLVKQGISNYCQIYWADESEKNR